MVFQRTALVVGVSNKRSLAWSSALALLKGEFDHVIVTYQNNRFKPSVEGMVALQNDVMKKEASARQGVPKLVTCLPCDVANEAEIKSLLDEKIPSLLLNRDEDLSSSSVDSTHSCRIKLDAMVHSVAFAPSQAMKSSSEFPLLNTTMDEYNVAHSISAYSLLSMSKYALPLLSCNDDTEDLPGTASRRSPSITALTYLGSSRAVRNYNVMGPAKASLEACVRGLAMEISPPPHNIRVNAISAGPVNTLAARGIRDFNELKHEAEERSFLKRSVTAEEVGSMVEFVAGSKASGVTGQILFCDGGYNAYGG